MQNVVNICKCKVAVETMVVDIASHEYTSETDDVSVGNHDMIPTEMLDQMFTELTRQIYVRCWIEPNQLE